MNPVVSCGEENLLGYPGDPYPNENIFVHEFAHAIHGTGLSTMDPTFDQRLCTAYEAAVERGLWKDTYAATNHGEYWAEGVQCWFDDNAPADALHNGIRTRAQLEEYDPALADLCREVFGDREWRYTRPRNENLKTSAISGATPEIDCLTSIGATSRSASTLAPRSRPRSAILTSNWMYKPARSGGRVSQDCPRGRFHSGQIRVVGRYPGEPGRGLVEGVANAVWLERPAERLQPAGLPPARTQPESGTIALIRGGRSPGAFVIFVGTPDRATGDIIPFGRVIKGMHVLDQLLAETADGASDKADVDIRRVIRTK